MTREERERYSRQILFGGLGEEGQERLLAAKVVIVGCGALGTVQAAALARAGVGTVTLIDRDYVELSNLQRQWLFEERDAADSLPKAVAASTAIGRANSGVRVIPQVMDLNPSNVEELLAGADAILDAVDNWETRYLVNDYALANGIPWIYGAAVGSYGITMPVQPGMSSCLKCVYPTPPSAGQPTCETEGVLGPLTAIIGAIQSGDALKLLTGKPVRQRVTTVDVWDGTVRQIAQPGRDPQCPACGAERDYSHLRGEGRPPISLCGRNAVQIHERNRPLGLEELKARLERLAPVRSNEFALRFFPDPYELTIFPDGRAIIKGTTDIGVARGLYAKYIGS